MGFKKGRAKRAADTAAASQASQVARDIAACDPLNISNDGHACVFYTASNGSEYKVDVNQLEQTNMSKGTKRVVHRRQGHDKSWTMWQFEGTRHPGRGYTHSRTTYIQYPKWVQFALDDRWRHLQSISQEGFSEKANNAAWREAVNKISQQTFLTVFNEESAHSNSPQGSCETVSGVVPDDDFDEHQIKKLILQLVPGDIAVQQALFDRVVNDQCSGDSLVHSLRWLIQKGFKTEAAHCRTIALTSGSLAALRVLVVEAKVDVCGIELLEAGTSCIEKHSVAGNGGWIQHCKHAVKLLLSRGAILGGSGSRSKLLQKLANEGESLWARRILNAMEASFPEFVIDNLEKFLGLSCA